MGALEKSPSKEDAMVLGTIPSNASHGEALSESYQIDPIKERKMMRKFDVGILIDAFAAKTQEYWTAVLLG
jgi:hypothetical protein